MTEGISVYYPFAMVECLGLSEDEECRAAGEVLLTFLDEGGCRVTLRLKREAFQALERNKSCFREEHAARPNRLPGAPSPCCLLQHTP